MVLKENMRQFQMTSTIRFTASISLALLLAFSRAAAGDDRGAPETWTLWRLWPDPFIREREPDRLVIDLAPGDGARLHYN